MKQTNARYQQIIIVFSMASLLIATTYFDSWQNWLKENAGASLESEYPSLRLWSLPVAALLFAFCWLVLFRFMNKHKNKAVAAIFLVVGSCTVFYPTIATTWGLSSKLGIGANYFGDTVLFYSSALVAAMGLMGMLIPAEKNE